MRLPRLLALIPLALLCATPRAARAQEHDHGHDDGSMVPGLGSVAFANSGSPAAQPAFLRGLALMHNFHYPEAATAFREAQQLDPGFAMAYWGEAMTYNHGIWREQDSVAARGTLARLAPTPEARAARAGTARERDYLHAVEVLYGAGRKSERDSAYALAAEEVARRYPDDIDAQLFHALALLSLPRNTVSYERAGTIARAVLSAHPTHPGALHYTIHAYDDPAHARLALDAAREYGDVAPAAAHARHMTSHIFIAMGMWPEMVAANEAALRSFASTPAAAMVGCGHPALWLQYGYLQQGRLAEARRMLAFCRDGMAQAPGRALGYTEMRLRYLVDEDAAPADIVASDADLSARPSAWFSQAFGTAWAALRRGDAAAATHALEAMRAARTAWTSTPQPVFAAREGTMRVAEREIEGLLRFRAGDHEGGLGMLRSAAALEDSLPFEFGPPAVEKPSHELVGEVLLEMGRFAEARTQLDAALARTPARPRVLDDLARVAEGTGDAARAAELRRTVADIRSHADAANP
jgi:tetratricopeptide (TPR) repeat protein